MSELERWPEWRTRWSCFRVRSHKPYPQCFLENELAPAQSALSLPTAIILLDGAPDASHPDLNRRFQYLFEASKEERMAIVDHATAMASIAIGAQCGFVQNIDLYSAPVVSTDKKIFEISLSRTTEILGELVRKYNGRCVVIGTFVSEPSIFIDKQIEKIMMTGIPVIWAAGNSGSNIEKISPVRLPEVISVGASTFKDAVLFESEIKSNYGRNLTVFAPGKYIYAAWSSAEKKYNLCSGTSAAAMIVASCVAKKIRDGVVPDQDIIRKQIIEEATSDLLILPEKMQAPNRMLYFKPDRERPRGPDVYE